MLLFDITFKTSEGVFSYDVRDNSVFDALVSLHRIDSTTEILHVDFEA